MHSVNNNEIPIGAIGTAGFKKLCLVVLIKLLGDTDSKLQMSHSEAVRAAQMDLNYSQAVVCGPRTKLDFGERLLP